MSAGIGQTLRRNARVSLITWFWTQGLNLVRMMVLIHFLSADGYGLWIFSFSIMSYFVMYDFGIANAFIKYTAELNAKRDYARLGELLSTGTTFGVLLGTGILVFFFFFTDAAVAFFNIPEASAPDARFVILGVAIVTAFSMATSVFKAVLTGIQRLDLANYVFSAGITIEFFTMIVMLRMGYGIQAVTVLYAANIIGSTLVCGWFVWRLLPEVRINPFRPRLNAVRPLVELGGKMQFLGMVAIMVSSLDIVIFMKYGSQAFVGVYGAAQRLAQRAQGLALQGFGMLAPASADLLAREEHAKLAEVFAAAQRFTAAGSALIFGYMAAFPEVLMHFVMDDEYEPAAAFALRALAIGLFFHTLTGPASSMLRGAGKPLRETVYQMLTGVLFLAFFFPLMRADADGALDPRLSATWPAALGIASTVFVLLGNRFFRVPLLAPFREMGVLLLATAVIGAGLRLGWEALPLLEPTSRWPAFVTMIATGIPYTILFVAAAVLLPGFTTGDREQLVRFVPGGGRFLSRAAARRGQDA